MRLYLKEVHMDIVIMHLKGAHINREEIKMDSMSAYAHERESSEHVRIKCCVSLT